MITGLKKWQKTTEIYFSEAKDPITISTFNTSLKNRLSEFAKEYPELCKLASDDEFGNFFLKNISPSDVEALLLIHLLPIRQGSANLRRVSPKAAPSFIYRIP